MPGGLALAVAVLATWRLCHLVAHEDGPFGAIAALRRRAGDGQAGRLMDCPFCLSLWFAAPFAVWLADNVADGVALWLAVSGAACLVEHVAQWLRHAAEPPIIDLPPPPE